MPLDESDAANLWDMLRHARAVVRMIDGFTEATYVNDERTRYAVERLIEVIGEAAKEVSESARKISPEIPWLKIIGQRHVLAHEYGTIDHHLLWTVASERVSELIAAIDLPLAQNPPNQS